jgi:hypothetical protein
MALAITTTSLVVPIFLGLLILMVVLIGFFGAFVVARVVEPRGLGALLRRVTGRT